MTIESSFQSQNYQSLLKDFTTIHNFHPEEGDLFAVDNDVLKITRGGFLQAPIRTIFNMTKGGYNPEESMIYLEGLANRTLSFLQHLHNATTHDLIGYHQHVRIVAKKIKLLYMKLYPDNFLIYKGDPRTEDLPFKERMAKVYYTFVIQAKIIQNSIKTKLPEAIPYLKEPIDFNESVASRLIDFRIPEEATIEDILRLAQTAEDQKTSEISNKTWAAVAGIEVTIGTLGAVALQPVKWLLWNPAEYFIKGEITTQNPVEWVLKNTMQHLNKNIVEPEFLLNHYIRWLFTSSKIITEAHVDAFCKLAHNFDSKYFFGPLLPMSMYELASSDPEELIEMIQDEITLMITPSLLGKEAKELIREIAADNPDGIITSYQFGLFLKFNFYKLLWVENPDAISVNDQIDQEWFQDFNGSSLEERKQYFCETYRKIEKIRFTNTFINLGLLIKIIDALGPNIHCTEFDLPAQTNILRLHQRLLIYKFVQDSNGKYTRQKNFND